MTMGKRAKATEIAVAGKWLFYFVLIGIIAGCGAILFHYLCGLGMHYFLDLMAGYRPSAPAGNRGESGQACFNPLV